MCAHPAEARGSEITASRGVGEGGRWVSARALPAGGRGVPAGRRAWGAGHSAGKWISSRCPPHPQCVVGEGVCACLLVPWISLIGHLGRGRPGGVQLSEVSNRARFRHSCCGIATFLVEARPQSLGGADRISLLPSLSLPQARADLSGHLSSQHQDVLARGGSPRGTLQGRGLPQWRAAPGSCLHPNSARVGAPRRAGVSGVSPGIAAHLVIPERASELLPLLRVLGRGRGGAAVLGTALPTPRPPWGPGALPEGD